MVQQKVRIIDIIIDHGCPTAAKMVKKAVKDTIQQTRKDMYKKKYQVIARSVFVKGRLESTVVNNMLWRPDKRVDRCEFNGREILAMRRTMPAFDFYFTVKEVK